MIETHKSRSQKRYPTQTRSTKNTKLRPKDRDPKVKIQKQIDQNKKPTSTKQDSKIRSEDRNQKLKIRTKHIPNEQDSKNMIQQ